MPFRIVENDITKVKADAVVRITDPQRAEGDGPGNAGFEAADRVSIAPASGMAARYMIECSVARRQDGEHDEADILRQCYNMSLETADDHNCQSIAFPFTGAEDHGSQQDAALQAALDSFADFLREHDMDIILAVPDGRSGSISGKLYDSVESFVGSRLSEIKRNLMYSPNGAEMRSEDPFEYDPGFIGQAEHSMSKTAAEAPKKKATSKSLEQALRGIYTDSFGKHLQQLINKKGLKNSEVYTAANISRQYFSKILKGRAKPSKGKVLALAVGLRLNMDETVDLLRLAGYAFSPISQTDTIVAYFIENGIYNVMKIDLVLFDYGLEPLS